MSKMANEVMPEVDAMLYTCLNDYGMTNEQALKHIENKKGSLHRAVAEDLLKKWEEEDNETD